MAIEFQPSKGNLILFVCDCELVKVSLSFSFCAIFLKFACFIIELIFRLISGLKDSLGEVKVKISCTLTLSLFFARYLSLLKFTCVHTLFVILSLAQTQTKTCVQKLTNTQHTHTHRHTKIDSLVRALPLPLTFTHSRTDPTPTTLMPRNLLLPRCSSFTFCHE